MKQPQGLIEALLDVTAAEADRDDAAMDLAATRNVHGGSLQSPIGKVTH